jgi:chromosome segregation ATPase
MITSLTSQLEESNDKLSHSSSLHQQLEKQLQGTEANYASLTTQLNESNDKLSLSLFQWNEARNQLSEVEKNYKLLTGDHDALSSTSLEQCDEVILTLTRSQEKLQQRRVSDEPTIFAFHIS